MKYAELKATIRIDLQARYLNLTNRLPLNWVLSSATAILTPVVWLYMIAGGANPYLTEKYLKNECNRFGRLMSRDLEDTKRRQQQFSKLLKPR